MSPREVVRLAVAAVLQDGANPRTFFHDETQAALMRSLAERGQIVPVLVRMEDGKPVVLDGNRRLRALQALGRPEVEAIVLRGPLSAADVLLTQIALGVHHDNLGPIDLARGIERLLTELGMSRAKVAQQLAISEPTICRKLMLLALSPALQERVQRGELPECLGRHIAETTKDHAEQEKLAARLLKQKQKSRCRKKDGDSRPQRFAACLGKGRTVTLAGPGLDAVEIVVEWMEELLAHAKKARSQRLALDTFGRLLRDQTEGPSAGPSKEAS